MFGEVWAWAGTLRKSEKTIGIDPIYIGIELKKLLDDTLFWIENSTWKYDDIAIRFKHRVVQIHCFPNGNGRHSRLMADIIIEKLFEENIFSWGEDNLVKKGDIRTRYIDALRSADQGEISELIKFARS